MPLVITTENRDFKPLGARIDYVLEARERLRELGPDYITLLADPRSESGRTTWFIDRPVTAQPASSLSEAEASALYDRLREMRVEINKLGDSIANPSGGRPGDKDLAQALRRLAVVPSDEHFVWSVNGKPLLVNWGQVHINDNRAEQAIIGEGLLPRKAAWTLPQAPPPTVVTPNPPSRWYLPFLAWLLFIALMGAIYLLLLRACGIFVATEGSTLARFLPNACHVASRPIDPSILAERADLERRIKEAQLNLARQVNDCPAPTPTTTPTPAPTPTRGPSIDDRLKQVDPSRTHTGKLQISLAWNGREDLDLHVKCPGGELNYGAKDACGGALDIDTNNGTISTNPVENGRWDSPPRGSYEIYVSMYQRNGEDERTVPFTVRLKREGQPDQNFSGSVSAEKQPVRVYSFDVP
jgi:hypothetical protein